MALKCLQGLICIEAFLDSKAQPKRLLSAEELKQINAQIVKELAVILPHLEETSYAIVGGIYQSSEFLQPGFPVHSQLRQYANAALKGENNRRNQLLINANDSGLPEGLKINTSLQLTPLLLMPFVILTDRQETQEIFEQQLMHKGMGSVTLLQNLQQALGVKIRHVNFMTVLDLAAMMHNHLQMAGCQTLWQILEQALFNATPETKVKTEQGNEFYLSKKIVFTPFFTDEFWQKNQAKLSNKKAQESYWHYTQVQRQYCAFLAEHGLDVRTFLADSENYPLDNKAICFASLDKSRLQTPYHHETVFPVDANKQVKVRVNSHPHLGIIYFKVTDAGKGLEYYYPLSKQGLKAIEKRLFEFK